MSTPDITIYSTPTCVYCHMAMNYLKSKNIAFKEVDVSQDAEGAKFVQDTLGYIATPVITIGDKNILGFDKPAIDAALHL